MRCGHQHFIPPACLSDFSRVVKHEHHSYRSFEDDWRYRNTISFEGGDDLTVHIVCSPAQGPNHPEMSHALYLSGLPVGVAAHHRRSVGIKHGLDGA